MTNDFENFITVFDSVVRSNPDHLAILTDGTEKTSYQTVAHRAQSIAALLPGSGLVAIGLEKSSDYIASLLACWYAGRPFLPLDPHLPPARRSYILKDSKPEFVITKSKYKDFFQDEKIILIDDIIPCPFAPARIRSDSQAYVIYTSGSTGNPKGVIVAHGGLVPMLKYQIQSFQLDASSRSLFYLSINFDASISDIGTALLSGATICIETKDKLDISSRLPGIVRERGITYMDIPPSLLRLLDPSSMPETLKTVVIGGEPCPPEIVRQWAKKFRVINVYGPTEATVCTSLCLCDPITWDKPLIGNPLPGVQYRIIDQELYIGGTQLAQGYLNQPELTEKKFILIDGHRFYRTGDLVRAHKDGTIEFLGRLDRQVKIRGQLVELEEIESQIILQMKISKCAVIKKSIEERDSLVAFIESDADFDAQLCQTLLRSVLPQWMIPGHFVILDKLPLTPSGKTDYTALSNQSIKSKVEADRIFLPRNKNEEILLQLWRKILKRQDIGPDDNFFDLGGDSLAVLELALDSEILGTALSPALIADFPTLSQQASCLSRQDKLSAVSSVHVQALARDIAPDETWLALFDLASRRPFNKSAKKKIFFTGATGFLGSRLLRALLENEDFHFYAFVRAPSSEEAWNRLSLPESFKNRIEIICGDLCKPRLGLSDVQWRELSETIDCIIHCAAVVNMVLPYQALRDANVAATQEVINLALTGKRKAVHYASTLSVFVSTDQNTGTVYEHDALENIGFVYGGYAQTKVAAELFVQSVPESSCEISTYRLGLITGDTHSGQSAPHDFLSMFIKGIIGLECVPEGPHDELLIDVTPVDYAVQVMTYIIGSEAPADTYHIANKKGFTLSQILRALSRQGHTIPIVSLHRWRHTVENLAQNQRLSPNEMAAFMALCRCFPGDGFSRYRTIDLFQTTNMAYDMKNTTAAIKEAHIALPEASDALLDIYLHRILSV